MEKTIRNQRIIIIILTVLLICNFFALSNLDSKLDNLNYNLSNSIQQVRSNVSTILSEIYSINEAKKQEASLITSFEYEYGELDESNFTVPVRVKIVPKAVGEDTALSLEFDGKSVEMKSSADSTAFTAEFTRGLFEKSEDDNVRLVVNSKGISETEELEWGMGDIYSEFMPYIIASYMFDDTVCSEENGVIVDGTVSVFVEDEDAYSFKNEKLIYKFNGEVVAEEATDGDGHIQIRRSFADYGIGDTFELYFEAEDKYGLIHEILLKEQTFTAYGENEDEGEAPLESDVHYEIIRDKDGNIIYS